MITIKARIIDIKNQKGEKFVVDEEVTNSLFTSTAKTYPEAKTKIYSFVTNMIKKPGDKLNKDERAYIRLKVSEIVLE